MVVVAFLSFYIFLPGVDAKEADGTIPFELQGKALEEIQSRAEYLMLRHQISNLYMFVNYTKLMIR